MIHPDNRIQHNCISEWGNMTLFLWREKRAKPNEALFGDYYNYYAWSKIMCIKQESM